mgnify:CR=1 FL=1
MSVELYDIAFVEKLRKWTKETDVSILTPNETKNTFSIIADKQNDQSIKLPLITLRRTGGFKVLYTGARPISKSGARLFANDETGRRLRAVPISISYQIDIYTRYQDEADEYTRNIVYNIINYPRLDVNIPYYDENRIHYSNIHMVGDVEDTSDIPERLISGQFSRMTIQIVVDDAYLFDVNYSKTKRIIVDPSTECDHTDDNTDDHPSDTCEGCLQIILKDTN